MCAENIESMEEGFLAFLWENLAPRDRIKVLSDMPKTAYFFGAGASHHYAMNSHGVNIPLANGFFEAFHDLPTSQGFQAHVGPLISYLQHYRGVKPTEASQWRENIEEFMTSIEREVDELRIKLRGKKKEAERIDVMKTSSLATTFNNMTFIFANVINEAQNGPSYSAYHDLLKLCGPRDTFISLNWDTLLDRALSDSGCWTPNNGYGVTFSSILDSTWKSKIAAPLVIPTEWRLIKLHGSTNWLVPFTGLHPTELEYRSIIPADDKIFLYWQATLPFETYQQRWRGGYAATCYGYYPPNLPASSFSEKSLAVKKGHVLIRMIPINIFSPFKEPSDKGVISSPLLITPVRQKKYDRYETTIERLWKQSRDALLSADRIVIIGYSFPRTDTRPLELLRATLESKKGNISIEIIDPYAKEVAARIGNTHLDKAKQVTIHELTFEDYIELIWQNTPNMMKKAADQYKEVSNWIAMIRAMHKNSISIFEQGSVW
jgi:hypothetical protein